MEKNKTKKKKTRSKYYIVGLLWIIFGAIVICTISMFVLITKGVIGYMPQVKDLENPIDKYASQIYSSDGELLGTYSQSKENRIYSSYDDLSPYLVQALIATEDVRFRSHSGVDAEAVMRAVVKRGVLQQKSGGGGSTISQQLAKLLYSPPTDNFTDRLLQKPIEWAIATQLERYYTKDEIINMYLNKFDFLNNAVGIKSAAKVYFNKDPKDLNVQESATLVGMCKNPSLFNPKRRPEATQGRRNVVLGQMVKAGFLTEQQKDSISILPLTLDYRRVDHKDGLAPYFREYLRVTMTAQKPDRSRYASWQNEQFTQDSISWETNPLYGWVNKNKKADGSSYNLYSDGLKIYATIDSRMQTYAEEAMAEHMRKDLQPVFDKEKKGRSYAPFSRSVANQVDDLLLKAMKVTDRYRGLKKQGVDEKQIMKVFKTPTEMKVFSWSGEIDTTMTPLDSIRYHKSFLRAGFMAMNPINGYVKAYVGGIDFKFFQYDMVNTGRRQVGSVIKPFLYTQAMEDGMTPCDQLVYQQQVLVTESGKEWIPRNASTSKDNIGKLVTIKWGLQRSDNWVTAYIMKQTSPYLFVNLLHSFGITGKIDPVVSLALGTPDVSVSEMTGGYSAFANKGIRAVPIYVTRIEDAFGNEIANFNPSVVEVFSELTSVKMLDMLRGVMDGGTGGRIRFKYGIKAPMGGKTGTTQNNSDGWFMAFTPKLVAGTWVGGEDRSIHFDGIAQGQGASMALPIFGLFMQKVYADPNLGYSTTDQFSKVKGDPNPCVGSSTDSELLNDANNVNSNGGIDDLYKNY